MKRLLTYILLLSGISLSSCVQDKIPLVSLGIEDVYFTARMQAVALRPAFTGESYQWTMHLDDGRDSLLSTEKDYIFIQTYPGVYNLRFEITDPVNPVDQEVTFIVMEETVEYDAYISRVLEYRPAPGQFVNGMPEYEEGDTEETMRQKAEAYLKGSYNNSLISLGAYGGYVTFAFDHTVMNEPGKRDFEIYGNSFYATGNEEERAGSSEPGIVMVAFDWNQNGVPDENEWYELAGSEYYKPETTKHYEITYYKPDENKEPVLDPDYEYYSDITYIPWADNQNETGYVIKNIYHDQSYWPKWINADKMTCKGTRLADNYYDASGNGTMFIQRAYDWGYADCHPNGLSDEDGNPINSFDIGWAVDKQGNKVYLPGVDFIRVYTGVNQYCGWLGETSTEISKARDLHINKSAVTPSRK